MRWQTLPLTAKHRKEHCQKRHKEHYGGQVDVDYKAVLDKVPDEETMGSLYDRVKEVLTGIIQGHKEEGAPANAGTAS